MHLLHHIFLRLLPALALLVGTSAHAADYCVSTPAQLQNAFNQAEVDNEDSVIRVRAGTLGLTGSLTYLTDLEGIVRPGKLSLRGGYNGDCSAITGSTTFTTNSQSSVILRTQTGDVRVSDLVFNGVGLIVFDNVLIDCGAKGLFEFDRLQISNANLTGTAACHDVDIRNSLFVNGRPVPDSQFRSNELLLGFYMNTKGEYIFPKLRLVNNTLSNGELEIINCCDGLNTTGIYNSIFSNDGREITNQTALFIYNSRYDSLVHEESGSLFQGQNNTSAATNLNAQFVPNVGSAMINGGTSTVPGGLADLDVYRSDRVIGAKVEIGAAESPIDGTGIYTVTNDNASGAGSLSAAIVLANADPADNQIRFNISGACPHRIPVTTALEVRDQLYINGYSQPGSSSNTSDTQWNGSPCIILDGVSNAGTGIVTGAPLAASDEGVQIAGLAFERFGVAILLSLGSDHRVLGSQFGGRVGSAGPTLRANTDSIFLLGKDSVIGGFAARDINLIGGATGSGIVITGASTRNNIVNNNIIGIDKNGISRLPNLDGIRIFARENLILGNRIGGNDRDGVVLRSASAYDNEISFNNFGALSSFTLSPVGNGRMGVFVERDAHDNTIGPNNRIGSNIDTGVRVFSDSGGRNRIVGNEIGNNGIGIDLGANGVTANNPDGATCDATLGCPANGEQNYPVLNSAVRNPPAFPLGRPLQVRGTLLTRVGGPYRVEFYANDSCDSSGFGEGQRFLGSIAVSVINSGVCTGVFPFINCFANFSTFFPTIDAAIGDQISALTVAPNGDTSEFSQCETVVNAPLTDPLFNDGFE